MKRITLILLIIILTGCQRDVNSAKQKNEASVEQQNMFETTDEMVEMPNEQENSQLTSEQMVEKYHEFVEKVKEINAYNLEHASEAKYADGYLDEEGNPLYAYEAMNTYFQNPGYCILDVNEDGIPELLFGENALNEGKAFDSYIYDMYTIQNGEIIPVFSGLGTRDMIYLTEDGKVGRLWTANWSDGGNSYYEYDGEKLILIEEYRSTAYYPSEKLIYTYRNNQNEKEVSEEEIEALQAKYKKKSITFTSFETGRVFKYETVVLPESSSGEEENPFVEYTEYLLSEEFEGWVEFEGYSKEELRFSLEYINSDSVPELVVGYSGKKNEPSALILSYADMEGLVSNQVEVSKKIIVSQLDGYDTFEFIEGEGIIITHKNYPGVEITNYQCVEKKGNILLRAYKEHEENNVDTYVIIDQYMQRKEVEEREFQEFVDGLGKEKIRRLWYDSDNTAEYYSLTAENLQNLKEGKLEVGGSKKVN